MSANTLNYFKADLINTGLAKILFIIFVQNFKEPESQVKLEAHSVERMYLRQRCSDGSR